MAFRLKTLGEITRHPLTRDQPRRALERYVRFHLGQLLLPYPLLYPWIGPLRLLARRGWAGVVGNLYTGLYDFEEMGFVLHCLRPQELFVDIGANLGVYALLAAGMCQADVVAVEPIPATYDLLRTQIRLNQLEARIDARCCGIGQTPGKLHFSLQQGTMNHVVEQASAETLEVPVMRLDDLIQGPARMLKLDTEGFELAGLKGGEALLASPELAAVLIELNGSGARYGFSDRECDDLLRRHGLAPYRYFPRQRRFEALSHWRQDQYNTLYLRDVAQMTALAAAAPAFEILQQRI